MMEILVPPNLLPLLGVTSKISAREKKIPQVSEQLKVPFVLSRVVISTHLHRSDSDRDGTGCRWQ